MNQWDQRFSGEQYIYGIQPNEFFKEELTRLKPGTILLPAEGEGRNAVFAAKLGWDVTAFDSSFVASEKALKLSHENGVSIDYHVSGYSDFVGQKNGYDAIGFVFSHVRNFKELYLRVLDFLKIGGVVIFEGFSKNQMEKQSGGPKDLDLLFSTEELSEFFSNYKLLKLIEKEVVLSEGDYHKGLASVIRILAIKQ